MSGLENLNLDWNVDIDAEIAASDKRQARRNTISESPLDWNMDLDDLLRKSGNPEDKEFRRHSAPTSLPSRKKAMGVKFGNVTIRECERILGDNPACEQGPSLSIGWKHKTHKPIHVDDWEEYRCQQHIRRTKKALQLSTQKRLLVAKEAGFSQRHIELNVELISYFHEERNETLITLHKEEQLPLDSLHKQKELAQSQTHWC
ncbi:expressed unknown protein [Seminavis robusta]|uniref:Uncharacterized protein n=1 Tax=Seminavis robusta TaxID=568900 RepID=A0A9N8ET55_9STRA|nr:expressed unknown protein [Seminavis robusta]|eukprot:Sro1611_g285920.1 n/a (203) ;mRNA; r:10760-11368